MGIPCPNCIIWQWLEPEPPRKRVIGWWWSCFTVWYMPVKVLPTLASYRNSRVRPVIALYRGFETRPISSSRLDQTVNTWMEGPFREPIKYCRCPHPWWQCQSCTFTPQPIHFIFIDFPIGARNTIINRTSSLVEKLRSPHPAPQVPANFELNRNPFSKADRRPILITTNKWLWTLERYTTSAVKFVKTD